MSKIIKFDELEGLGKKALIEIAEEINSNLVEDEMTTAVKLKKLIFLADEIKKLLEPKVIDQLRGVKTDNAAGAKLTYKANNKPMLDYRQDIKYQTLEDATKYRRMLLDQSFNTEGDYIDPESGEVVPKVKVKGYRKESVTIEF